MYVMYCYNELLFCLYFHIQKKVSPLQKAVYRNHIETASLLKECGGDPSIDTKVIYVML